MKDIDLIRELMDERMLRDDNIESAIQRFAYSIGTVVGTMDNENVKERLRQQYGPDIAMLEQTVHSIYSAMRKES